MQISCQQFLCVQFHEMELNILRVFIFANIFICFDVRVVYLFQHNQYFENVYIYLYNKTSALYTKELI